MTRPVALATVAIVVVPLVQLPPEVVLLKDTEEPTHTLVAPEIAAGNGFTENTCDDRQPVDNR